MRKPAVERELTNSNLFNQKFDLDGGRISPDSESEQAIF